MTSLSFDVLWRDRGAQQGMQKLGDTTEKTSHKFRGLKIAGAAALAAVGIAAVKFGSDSVKAYVGAEGSQIRLHEAFRKFPKLADTNIGSLNKLNSALALKTRYDDDATSSGQAVLAQFNLTGQQITKLTPLLQDYAAKTGKDLPTAAKDLGKAMLGNGKALKNIGVDFKDTGTASGNLQQLMGGLRSQVGGFAEKEGKSAAGQAEILRNQFGELQESAGKQLLPTLLKVGGGLLKFVGFVQELSPVFGSFKKIAGSAFSSLADSLGVGHASFKTFADFVLSHQGDITAGFVKVAKFALGIGDAVLTTASVVLRGFAMIMDAQSNLAAVSLSQFGKILQGASMAFGWIPGIGPKLKDASSKFDAFAGTAVNGMRKAADGARAAADGIDTKLNPALDKAGRAMDDVSRKEIIKAEARDRIRRTANAIRDLGTDADGAQIHLKRFADRSKLSASQQQALHNRIKDVKGALKDQLGAMQDARVGQGKLTAAWQKGKDRLYDEFRQMGLSKREAKDLAAKYAGIKPKVKTDFTTPGLNGSGGARSNTKDYDLKIRHVPEKWATKVSAPGATTSAGQIKGVDNAIEGIHSKSTSLKFASNATTVWDRIKHVFGKAHGGIVGRARGGLLPGNTPLSRGDDIAFPMATGGIQPLRGGEGIYVTEAMQNPFERARMFAVNRAALRGESLSRFHGPTAEGLRTGGSVSKINASTSGLSGAFQGLNTGAFMNTVGDWISSATKPLIAATVARFAAAARARLAAAAARAKAALGFGGGGGHKMSGSIISIARSFHPSYIAGHRDPQGGPAYDIGSSGAKNNAIANALRVNHGRLGLRYVISQMRIASARSGWGWRRYSPITGSGDFRHVGHVHVSYDTGGMLRREDGNRTGRPERVLSPAQTSSFDRMTRVMDRGGSVGNTYITVNAPNYVGQPRDLVAALVSLDRSGHLQVIKR